MIPGIRLNLRGKGEDGDDRPGEEHCRRPDPIGPRALEPALLAAKHLVAGEADHDERGQPREPRRDDFEEELEDQAHQGELGRTS